MFDNVFLKIVPFMIVKKKPRDSRTCHRWRCNRTQKKMRFACWTTKARIQTSI